MSSGSFKNVIYKMWLEIIYLIYIYKEDLVGFYGISTIVDYLMPNLVDTYILDIYDL